MKLTSEVHNVEIAHLVPSSASDVGLMVDAGGIVGAPGGGEEHLQLLLLLVQLLLSTDCSTLM